jgi:hypothetical protein
METHSSSTAVVAAILQVVFIDDVLSLFRELWGRKYARRGVDWVVVSKMKMTHAPGGQVMKRGLGRREKNNTRGTSVVKQRGGRYLLHSLIQVISSRHQQPSYHLGIRLDSRRFKLFPSALSDDILPAKHNTRASIRVSF